MILKIFAIKDTKIGAFAQPYYGRSTGEGVRAFEDIFTTQDPQFQWTPYKKNPQDYHLYEIGEFDDETGEVRDVPHVSLASGSNYIS